MKANYVLFKILNDTNTQFFDENKYKVIDRKIGKKTSIKEKRSAKTILIRSMIGIFTLCKAKIYYVLNNNDEIIHTSYTIPRYWKLRFLPKKSINIGPCYTYEKYRCKGIYYNMIKYISYHEKKDCYMIVSINNKSSLMGIDKIKTMIIGKVYKSTILGIYKLKKDV